MSDDLPPLSDLDKRLLLEVQRLMDHYRLTGGDELYRSIRDYSATAVAKERERIAKEWDGRLYADHIDVGDAIRAGSGSGS